MTPTTTFRPLHSLSIATAFVAIAAIVLATSCRTLLPTSNLVEKTFDISDFSGVDITDAFDCSIQSGPTFSVKITTNEDLADELDVYRSGNRLHVGEKPGTLHFGTTTLRAVVVMPSLSGVKVDGASDLRISGFLSAQALTATIGGAATLAISNSAYPSGTLNVSGASVFSSPNSVFGALAVDASGASTVDVDIADSITGTLTGASTLTYGGSPTLSVNSSGASTLRHK